MTISYGDWQPGHLRLGAPELYVLRHGPDKATEIFKLALHELVARGVVKLAILQQGSGRTTTHTVLLRPGVQRPRELSRPLSSIMDAYDGLTAQQPVDASTGIAVEELARALRERHQGTLSQWVTDEVVGTLVERHLYAEEQHKRLGLFNTTSYEPTPDGKAAQAELEASIKRAEDQFGSWASGEPARAAAFLAIAGPAVLVMPDLQPAIERFRGASHGARKMMAASSDTAIQLADQDFDFYRLVDAANEIKTLDDVIDYGQLDRDRSADKG